MSFEEQLRILLAFALVGIGGGLVKRGRRAVGWTLIVGAIIVIVIAAIDNQFRPLIAAVTLTGTIYGLELDDHGHRAWGLLAFSVGFLALLSATFIR